MGGPGQTNGAPAPKRGLSGGQGGRGCIGDSHLCLMAGVPSVLSGRNNVHTPKLLRVAQCSVWGSQLLNSPTRATAFKHNVQWFSDSATAFVCEPFCAVDT